jgi:chromosome condensin MukBEF ATPase and DNA-binding subunit MukB
MLGPLQSLKKLESLVKEASEALQKTASENRALKEKLARIEAEHKRAKEELREAKLTLARHERLKARLVKLHEKLERIS